MPQVDIPQDLYDRLQRLLPGEQIHREVAKAALTEWADWLDGSFRPMTMSDLETRRIKTIYRRILTKELPTAEHLGKWLRLPMGRARYIIQSLAYRYGRWLQLRQLDSVIITVADGTWSQDKTTCVVLIDPSCRVIIDRFLQLLLDQNKISEVRGKATAKRVRYELGETHHIELLKALRDSLSQEQKQEDPDE